MTLQEIKNSISDLITEDMSDEKIKEVKSILEGIDTATKEYEDLVIKHGELRSRYIDLIKNTPVYGSPLDTKEEQKEQPKDLDALAKQLINSRKGG